MMIITNKTANAPPSKSSIISHPFFSRFNKDQQTEKNYKRDGKYYYPFQSAQRPDAHPDQDRE
jgi:hypothetical protein